ncbi:hypothetical protein ACFPM0_07940 [Pseudonocardia sulfidoxydans]|uniref:hypothetical protein n=1 Tax=Pseudonocardia sulfidoxydans TaxID=54011 RepID=UPI0036153EEA
MAPAAAPDPVPLVGRSRNPSPATTDGDRVARRDRSGSARRPLCSDSDVGCPTRSRRP